MSVAREQKITIIIKYLKINPSLRMNSAILTQCTCKVKMQTVVEFNCKGVERQQ